MITYFTCPYCKVLQIDDKGNYKCCPCEDGKNKPKFKWMWFFRTYFGERKYRKFGYSKFNNRLYNWFGKFWRLIDKDIWRYI